MSFCLIWSSNASIEAAKDTSLLGRLQDLERGGLIRRDPGAKHTLPYRCFITDAGRERLAEPSMARPA